MWRNPNTVTCKGSKARSYCPNGVDGLLLLLQSVATGFSFNDTALIGLID